MKNILVLFIIFISLNADMFEPNHNCYKPSKPFKPYSFNSQWELDNYKNQINIFKTEVQTYQSCINRFISQQEDEIQNHQNAINNSIDEWNSFVNYELN